MKEKILFFTFSFIAIILNAQNSQQLNIIRNAYRVSDKIVKQQVEYRDPGSCGRGLFWNFGMIQPINEEYSLSYLPKAGIDTNLICGLEHNTRYYYRQQKDSIWATGFENSTTYMDYVKPELRLKFPFVYGDTLFSCFEGRGQYCHRLSLKVTGFTRVEADAEGELLLPNRETVKKALRVHSLRYYTETGKDSIEMVLDTYAWYAAGIRYPVFESIKTNLIKKASKQAKDTTVFTTSFYYPPELQISQIQTDPVPEDITESETGVTSVFTEAKYMPNPVVSDLQISYKLTRSAKVWFSLHNNAGILQRSTTTQNMPEGYNNAIVNMSGLIPGTYSLYVHVDDIVIREVIIKR